MKHWVGIIIGILVLNFLLIAGLGSLMAQDPEENKRTPIDSYPLPSASGAAKFTLGDRWNTTDLTFYIHNCPSRRMECREAHEAVRNAFRAWGGVSALSFSEVGDARQADIELRWAANEEELGQPGGVLAFAFFPSFGGDVFFDDTEPWTLYDGGSTDFYVVAIHEIGHALGLDHSDDESAVMFPYSGGVADLGRDDIAGIQRLYGADDGRDEDVIVVEPPADIDQSGVETAEGNISSRTYFETWLIDITAGETVTLNLEALSGDLDAYLILLTPDGETILDEDDDGLGGTDSTITYTFPSDGQYQIIVTRYNTDAGMTGGDYRLTALRQGTDPNFNPNGNAGGTIPNSTVMLSIYNNSRVTICGIWFTENENPEWGQERLSQDLGQALQSGFYFVWEVSSGYYDVWIEDCNGNYFEQYAIEVLNHTEIEVHKTNLEINPLSD